MNFVHEKCRQYVGQNFVRLFIDEQKKSDQPNITKNEQFMEMIRPGRLFTISISN